MKKTLLLVLLLAVNFTFSQKQKNYKIGLLIDRTDENHGIYYQKLKKEITSVVGRDGSVSFSEKDILVNNLNIETAKQNYEAMLASDVDIILAFGPINNVVITKVDVYKKPTILYGALNKELIQLNQEVKVSGIDNFTYLVTSQSFEEDLKSFKKLYDFKRVGLLVDDFLLNITSVNESLREKVKALGVNYELIPYATVEDIKLGIKKNQTVEGKEPLDAVYLAGGDFLSEEEVIDLSNFLIEEKLPSFTASYIDNVKRGLLATNQAEENIERFFRRLALNIEAIINGKNPSELSIHLDLANKLTVNYNTAKKVDMPIRYSLMSTINFIGDFNEITSTKKYTLQEVMNQTLENNLNLLSEQKSVDLAAQEVKTAKSNYLPEIAVSGEGSYMNPNINELIGTQDQDYQIKGNVTLSQTLFSNDANAGITIQKNLEKAQKETYNIATLDAVLDASTAYFNTLILKSNVKIQSRNLDVTKKNLEIATQNYEAGLSEKIDVLRLKSEQAQNTQTLVEATNQLQQGFYVLNQLLNNDINFAIDVEDAELNKGVYKKEGYVQLEELLDNSTFRSPFVEFLVNEAIIAAPEIKFIDYNLKVAERSMKLNAGGRFVPTLALQGQYSHNFTANGPATPGAPDFRNTYNVGLNLSLPIFQRNQKNINTKTFKIQQEQLNLNRENVNLSIERSVNESILKIVEEISNISLSTISEETAKESLELTQISYSNGAVNITQLIDAQRNYLQAQLSNANANYNYLLSLMALQRNINHFFLLHSDESNGEFMAKFAEFIETTDLK